MLQTRRAKLFKNGASQAIRLPAEFRFNTEEVYITRDDETGDVVLSNHPGAKAWTVLFDLLRHTDCPVDFMRERPMNDNPLERSLFDEDK
jgi:antitoxin VapB